MIQPRLLWTGGVLTLVAAGARAQGPEPDAGLVALRQACLDASTDGVVLNVAAHPDDESSRTNTILRRKYGLRVVTVYTTYGDGGQNAIGKEIGPDLAWLRVRETLRAAAMMDFDVHWLGLQDFGYSKSLEETQRVWGQDALLDAMRRVVDAVDPDIIVTNHNLTEGHGHHRASYWAVVEVLKERAGRGQHAPPLYRRCNLEEAQVSLDPGELDPARGETYARMAHRAWTQHVTQGPWGPHDPLQVQKDHWRLAFPEGVEAAAAADPQQWVRRRVREYTPTLAAAEATPPNTVAAALQQLELLRRDAAPAGALGQRWHRHEEALQRAALAAAGVRVEAWLERDEVARGGEGKVFVVVHGVGRVRDLTVRCGDRVAEAVAPRVRPATDGGQTGTTTSGATPVGASATPAAPSASTPQVPAAPPQPVPGRLAVTFAVDAAALHVDPQPAWIEIEVAFELDGARLQLRPRLPYTPVDPVELRWDRAVVLVPKGQTVDRIVSASVRSWRPAELSEPVRLGMGAGIRAEAIPGRLSLSREHPEARLLVRATFTVDELASDAALRVDFAGQSAKLRIVPIEVFVPPGLRVGLVRGPDDTVERTLADLGIAHVVLDRDALATVRLEEFTTLLLDMRAYFHVPELAEHRDRILQYCRAGGRVVAMYHKPGEWNERQGHPLLAPFPLTIGNDRVSEADSPVTMLAPEHRLWHHPHAISMADFDGWVQERGLNFPGKWDAAWTPLLQLEDRSDKKPHQGALLYTQYGRGDFVYCSLVLYRQLRDGHAGAARLLVNLLAR